MSSRVRIFDTTLRDGEQSPGATMTAGEKLVIARALARLGVDAIEAGFPAASPDDLASVRAIARDVGTADAPPIICALARTSRRDIELAWDGVRDAARPRLHTFLATSDLHLQHKLRMTRAEVLARVAEMVGFARTLCADVEFSAEDAGRSDPAFLHAVLEVAIRAGASTLNIPDTVGYTTPDELGALIAGIRNCVDGVDRVVLSVHCHDDLGLATANSLAGLIAGARQAEVTINGIGERAGNTSLEELVMTIHTRADKLGLTTGIDTTQLTGVSQLVSATTGIVVPPNKAIVGANAFAHEAGIHQDGMLKHQATYEIMRPETVGAAQTRLVLGKHSGRAALSARLAELGVRVADGALERVFARFKAVAERQKQVSDAELARLAGDEPRTLFQKLWDAHVVAEEPDRPAVLYIDLHLVHEVTSPQAFAGLRARGLAVRRADRTFATMDHSIPTLPRGLAVIDAAADAQLAALAANCRDHGITLYDTDSEHQGIVHVIGPELGLTLPGSTIVCGDSHTSTHGAFGALAFGIGTSEVEHVLATQCLLQHRPRTLEVRVDGRLSPGVGAKDLVLALIAQIGVGGATGHVIEYTGEAIRALDMEGRMTVCNMSIEAGARAGLIAPDDVTFAYLAGRPHAPRGEAWEAAVARWRSLRTDDGAAFDRTIVLDGARIAPMITFGTNPGMGIAVTAAVPSPDELPDGASRAALDKALRYMDLVPGAPLLGKGIDVVFIGSCTNSRIGDLRAAARIMAGRSVARGVRALVVPGSKAIKRQAEAEGLDRVFRAAGAEWREAGCSMCIAMNGDQLAPGQYAVSTSNRNFEGRQGRGGRTFLASPITAAAAAITGRITDPRTLGGQR